MIIMFRIRQSSSYNLLREYEAHRIGKSDIVQMLSYISRSKDPVCCFLLSVTPLNEEQYCEGADAPDFTVLQNFRKSIDI